MQYLYNSCKKRLLTIGGQSLFGFRYNKQFHHLVFGHCSEFQEMNFESRKRQLLMFAYIINHSVRGLNS